MRRIARLLLAAVFTAAAGAAEKPPVRDLSGEAKHVVAAARPGFFCGWPANEGIWAWGNEILVGFYLAPYRYNPKGHSVDGSKPGVDAFARSLDGGETWSFEPASYDSRAVSSDGCETWSYDKEAKKLTRPLDFSRPGFAMKLRNGRMYCSYDRGRSWGGSFRLRVEGIDRPLRARTDYIVEGAGQAKIFLPTLKSDGASGRSLMAETTDGGQSFHFVGWLAPEPETPKENSKHSFSIMPSTVKLPDGTLVTALRERRGRKKWIEIRRSVDGGRTWESLSIPSRMAWNPPSLIRLADGRLCLTYGDRCKPYSIRARLSGDGGRSWGPVLILRRDAASWDMGYVRSVQRPDGKIVTLYYHTTAEHPEQFIAGTVWQP